MDSSDEVIAVAAQMDELAFEELHRRYAPIAWRMAHKHRARVPRLDVEDAASLATTRLWRALPGYDPSRPFENWASVVMSRAVRTAVANATTGRANFNWSAMLHREAGPDQAGRSHLERATDSRDDVHIRIELDEEERILAALLAETLSHREAECLRLRLGGWSYAEIATRTSLDVKAVDNALQRSTRKLRGAVRRRLARTGDDES